MLIILSRSTHLLIHFGFDRPVRLEPAQRIGPQSAAGRRIGPRTRPSAQHMILAGAAAAFERLGIVQQSEQRRVAINVGEPGVADIARHLRQKSRGRDVARARYEDDAVAVANSESARGRAALDLFSSEPFGAHFLNRDAAIGRRFGGRDDERCGLSRFRKSSPLILRLPRRSAAAALSLGPRRSGKTSSSARL